MMEKKKILIVEDEPEMRAVLTLELETSGYQVFQAENGEVGLQVAKSIRPDLILSDVLMPKMDGSKFLKELRSTDFGKGIPFIVLTARGKMRDYFEVVEVDDFIEKPFSPDELLARIEKILSRPKTPAANTKKESVLTKSRSDAVASQSIPKETELVLDNRMIDDTKSTPSFDIGQKSKQKIKHENLLGKKKVLILEGDPTICIEFQKEFSSRGYAASAVFTPGRCLNEAMNFRPNVIIMKKFSREDDLESFIRNLRGVTGSRDLPVIVYDSIGQKIAGTGPSDPGIFRLSEEGQQVIEKVEDLLAE